MTTILGVLQVFLCVVLIFLVLMHSGKDAGLSGAFGVGTGAAPLGAGAGSPGQADNRCTRGLQVRRSNVSPPPAGERCARQPAGEECNVWPPGRDAPGRDGRRTPRLNTPRGTATESPRGRPGEGSS